MPEIYFFSREGEPVQNSEPARKNWVDVPLRSLRTFSPINHGLQIFTLLDTKNSNKRLLPRTTKGFADDMNGTNASGATNEVDPARPAPRGKIFLDFNRVLLPVPVHGNHSADVRRLKTHRELKRSGMNSVSMRTGRYLDNIGIRSITQPGLSDQFCSRRGWR